MSEYLNISQIARELNVSRQAIYSKLKLPEIKSVMCQYTVRHNNRTLYTSDFVNVLKQAFGSVNTVQTLDTIRQEEVSSPLQSQLDLLKATIDTLTNQLAEKDKQLSDAAEERRQLTEERQATLARLFKTEDENKALKLELNEYKSIVDKKKNVIEVDATPTKEQAPTPTPEPEQKELAEDPPPQKLSFFKRLLRRK